MEVSKTNDRNEPINMQLKVDYTRQAIVKYSILYLHRPTVRPKDIVRLSGYPLIQDSLNELRRAIVRYQDSVTMGKSITGCAIGHVLMYLDCLIRGKTAEPDMRVPRICYMDPAKLSDLVDADLIKRRQCRSKDLGVWEASGEFCLFCLLQTFF